MILNFFLFPIFIYLVSLFGKLFKKIFDLRENDFLFVDLIFGFFFISITLFIFNFFIKLHSFFIFIFLFSLFIYGLKHFFFSNFAHIKKNLLIILIISCFSIFMEPGYDSFLYHIPFQSWIQEEKAMIGMANLNLRFGLSSINSYFSSILWFNNIFLFVSYASTLFYLIFFLIIKEFLKN